jgi:hypothetical protein
MAGKESGVSYYEQNRPEKFGATIQQTIEQQSLFGGSLEVIEALPTDPSTGYVQRNTPSLYYAHGAGGHEIPTINHLAKIGQPAFFVKIRGERTNNRAYGVINENGEEKEVPESELKQYKDGKHGIIPLQQVKEALSVLHMIDQMQQQGHHDGPTNLLVQSESACHGLLAIYADYSAYHLNSDQDPRMGNLVLAYPGGISGPQEGFIPRRMLAEWKTRRDNKVSPENSFREKKDERLSLMDKYREMRQDRGFRADAAALRHAALAPTLHAIKALDTNPMISLVAGIDDNIFPLAGYFNRIRSPHDIDLMMVTPGGHGIQRRKDVMGGILDLFPQMDDLRKSREQAKAKGINVDQLPLHERIIFFPGVSQTRQSEVLRMAEALDKRSQAA